MANKTRQPPYYAVIFTSRLSGDIDGYDDMATNLEALAASQPGFLGIESARGQAGLGITVSYWDTLESIARWRDNAEHSVARAKGNERWYSHYELRIARVERAYDGPPPARSRSDFQNSAADQVNICGVSEVPGSESLRPAVGAQQR